MDFSKIPIGELASLPEFQGFDYMIAEENPELAPMVNAMDISQICHYFTEPIWEERSLTEGVEFLYNRACSGQVFYTLPPDGRRLPLSVNTGLAAFPVPDRDAGNTPFVILCPGGSFRHVCKIQEGYPVAKRLNELGVAAFVLQYGTGQPFDTEASMEDIFSALNLIQRNKDAFRVDPDHYVVMGFSAGGLVAALWGTKRLGYARYHCRKPDCLILAYPAISTRSFNEEDRLSFFGADYSEDDLVSTSADESADKDYPPSFIWLSEDDPEVPKEEHASLLVEKLKQEHVPVCFETYPGALHGTGLGDHTSSRGWIERAVKFWQNHSER